MIDLNDKPLPQADSASARLAAQRASALADELSRLQQQLRGATSQDGWTGAARLAFDESMQGRIAMFDPVIRRYQSYASSLNSYAQAVDQVELPLRTLRSRLDNQPRGPDGAPGDAELLNQYQRLWSTWDDARRRCLSDLERASHFGADRHGLSKL